MQKPNAQIAPNKYPVIIYLPVIGSEDVHNIYLEELASHGYVIAAIDPPYDILVTKFPNNKIIKLDQTLENAIKDNNREIIYQYRNQAHERWYKYIEAAIKYLQKLNADQNSMFYNKLNLNAIGVMGHSQGGAVALDFCKKNDLCKAGINMDGWTKTYNSTEAFNKPFLFMLSEGIDQPGMKELLENNQRTDYEQIVIRGSNHGYFSDAILQKKLSKVLGFSDKPYNMVTNIKNKIVKFFDKYVKNKSRD